MKTKEEIEYRIKKLEEEMENIKSYYDSLEKESRQWIATLLCIYRGQIDILKWVLTERR